MSKSKRDPRIQLPQAIQAPPAAPLSGTQSVQNETKRNLAGVRSFSSDPSPFTRRPSLAKDSSAYRALVALAAYYRAERRGFAPGGEVEDWLEAEREVAARVSAS